MLKESRKNAASSIGLMIALGRSLLSKESQSNLNNKILPSVVQLLPELHFRVQKSYSLVLAAAKLVSKMYNL